jgi:(p)ppGpp synthase/HD superfamily hydrolase
VSDSFPQTLLGLDKMAAEAHRGQLDQQGVPYIEHVHALSEGRWIGKLDQMAADAHRGQFDKAGVPYIEHVHAVADSVSHEARPVALFHDALEDTPLTPEQLKTALVEPKIMTPEEAQTVVDAVKLLTHDKKVDSYEQYVEKVRTASGKAGELAREVKRADLQHNLGRLTPELERLRARYVGALELLG